ncbi:efflux RND transporter periplasmic adaptor subunit [bacterium]|nr:efflux RND transporter periplasmic adaptor subunit [bacterium]
MKTVHAVILMLAALVLAGCFGGGWGGGWSMPPTPVEVTQATMQQVSDRFQTIGTVEADEAVTVVAEMGGIVERIPFDEGGRLGRGDLIAQLDDGEFRAALDRATAVRDQARLTYNRVKTIVERGASAQQELDEANAALKVAEANVAFAKAQHDKTQIRAPFSGVAGARKVSPGAYVQPGTPITEFARTDLLRVSFSVPERYVGDLREGAPVMVLITAYPDSEFVGEVMVVEPQVDAMTRNIGIVARLDNTSGLLRPGMSANVAVTLRVRDAALTIASEAVFLEQNQPYVFVVKADSTIARTPVRLGSRTRGSVEIISGVDPSQLVVRAGQQKIFDGAKVIPVSSADSVKAIEQAMQAQAQAGAAQ